MWPDSPQGSARGRPDRAGSNQEFEGAEAGATWGFASSPQGIPQLWITLSPSRHLDLQAHQSKAQFERAETTGESGEVESTPAQRWAGGARIIDTRSQGFKT